MKLEDTLREALQRDAAELVPVGPGPDDARRRAFRRKRRMQAGVVTLSAVVLAGGSLAVIETRSSGSAPRVQAQPTAPTPTPELSWRTVDGTVLYTSTHFTTTEGVTYALSTAPGVPSDPTSIQPQELYATRDGAAWTHTSLGAAPWVADLTSSNGVLYAVGTGPGSQDATDYKLSTSSDGGAQWDQTAIPVSFTPPAASVRLTPSESVRVARGPHTTVVIASVSYTPDVSSVTDKQMFRTTADGVEVVGRSGSLCMPDPSGAPSKCKNASTSTVPWSDLGITQPAALQQQEALVRDDGGAWKTVTMAADPGVWVQDVAATSNGFLLAESVASDSGRGTARLLASPDGHTWTPRAGVPAFDGVSISGDRVMGVDSQTSTVYVSNDAGVSWDAPTVVGSLIPGGDVVLPYTSVTDVGPLGYAIVAQTQPAVSSNTVTPNTVTTKTEPPSTGPSHTYVIYSVDGSAWNVSDLGAQGAPANGSLANMSVGADHIEVTFQIPASAGDASTPWKLSTLVGTPKA